MLFTFALGGTFRSDLGRRHGIGDLFHRRFHDPAGNAAVDASKPPDRAKGHGALARRLLSEVTRG
jgi:hypothetical protein